MILEEELGEERAPAGDYMEEGEEGNEFGFVNSKGREKKEKEKIKRKKIEKPLKVHRD